jgi:hypothetical protein
MITYKLVNDRNGKPMCVNRSDGWSIPFSPDNTDYQAYLAWLAEGNTPLPADKEVA